MKAIDKFGRYLGLLDITVGEEELKLDVRLKDKHKLMSSLSKSKSNDISEDQIILISDVLLKILKRSYLPYYDSKEDVSDAQTDEEIKQNLEVSQALEAFMTQKFEKLISAISVAFGWTTQDKITSQMNNLKKNP